MLLDQARLKDLLVYEVATGYFRWRVSRRGASAGLRAGVIRPTGYRQLVVDRRAYYEHCLAFLYMTGQWPECEIDHINGVRHDNRWGNLRQVSKQQNAWNKTKLDARNTHGLKGVRRNKKKFMAMISLHGKEVYLGSYATAEAAHAAYCSAAREHHGEFFGSKGLRSCS